MLNRAQPEVWMRPVLLCAAAYNVLWGTFAILSPSTPFVLAGMPLPNYPELWQGIGLLVALFGIAYSLAAFAPYRHWPVVLVGLLSKVLGAAAFANLAMRGRLPWTLGWIVLVNDVLWCVPFGLILWGAYRASEETRRIAAPEIQRMALRARTQTGETLLALSEEAPLLAVFLRHAGCTFCREALADLAAARKRIEASGTRIVLVHMNDAPDVAVFLGKYGLSDVHRVADNNLSLYRAFGLQRARLSQIFGWKAWFRVFDAGILHGHGIGWLGGDAWQMPGVFLIYYGEALRSYRHQSVADRPNYAALARWV